MKRNEGITHILLIIIILIISVFVVMFIGGSGKDRSGGPPEIIKKLIGERESGHDQFANLDLPDCEGKQYSVPLVNLDEIQSISPLGNLNPPEHTTPTNHLYINLKSTGVTLKSPGDITISSISSSENADRGTTDYSIDFSLCEDVHGYFIHVKTLTPELEKLLSRDNCQIYGDGGKYKNCQAQVNKKLKAGEVIGTVGNNMQGNFDFGAYDLRTRLDYANPDRYAPSGDTSSKTLTLVCGLDYYSEFIKEEFYEKLEREIAPLCGEVAQDIAGTLQGNWFFENADATSPDTWTKHLTFGHENTDPGIATISIGGVFTDFGTYSFIPKSDGLTNRDFSEVKPDGNVYCFESAGNVDSESRRTDGKILVKLVNDVELQIEHQSEKCTENSSFTNPTVYKR